MLEEIIIRNYKIFKGTHKISLSTDPAAPVTVIVGKGASGKTTISDAVRWCLYGSRMLRPGYDKCLMNHERFREMADGDEEEVSVELLFPDSSYCRKIVYKKQSDELFTSREEFTHKGNVVELPQAPLNELLFWDETIVFDRSLKRLAKQLRQAIESKIKFLTPSKQEVIISTVMCRIANRADDYFQEMYFRNGNFRVRWDNGFFLEGDDMGLSSTDQLVFNVSVLLASYDALIRGKYVLPLVIDNIFTYASPNQFPVKKLLSQFSRLQALLLFHDYTFDLHDVSKEKVGITYRMQLNDNNHTSASLSSCGH